MNKNIYGTLEYLTTNIPISASSDQYVIVQEDGDFVLNQDIQYVTEIQNTKENPEGVQHCDIYDVTSQKYYVDINNTPELLTASGQYVLQDKENNLYENCHLIEPSPNADDDQIERHGTNSIENERSKIETVDNKIFREDNQITEITLNEELYEQLENKGWVLLEINEKVFILDSLGLHDITSNENLIQRLREENVCSAESKTKLCLKIENQVVDKNNQNECKKIDENELTSSYLKRPIKEEQVKNETEFDKNETKTSEEISTNVMHRVRHESKVRKPLRNGSKSILKRKNSARFKININSKAIPDKIILGRSGNGKRLVAKILKVEENLHEKNKQNLPDKVQACSKDVTAKEDCGKSQLNIPPEYRVNPEDYLRLLLQGTLHRRSNLCCSNSDVEAARDIIEQLLTTTPFKNAILNCSCLFITKVIVNEDHVGNFVSEDLNGLLVGRVISNPGDQYIFENITLNKLILRALRIDEFPPDGRVSVAFDCGNNLHIHVTDTRRSNITRTSKINISKCKISLI